MFHSTFNEMAWMLETDKVGYDTTWKDSNLDAIRYDLG
jgi:hypothetical protein